MLRNRVLAGCSGVSFKVEFEDVWASILIADVTFDNCLTQFEIHVAVFGHVHYLVCVPTLPREGDALIVAWFE